MSRSSKSPAKLRGRVERVFFAGPKFSAGKLTTFDGDTVSFAGNLFAQEGAQVQLEGRWTTDPKYGKQFKVDRVIHDIDLDADGLIHYLSNHPEIKGIGPAKARKIVEALGDKFENTLINDPATIAQIGQISLDKAEAFRKEWVKSKDHNAVMTWLSSFELTHYQAKTLEEKLGANCLDVLRENPYVIAREIRGFGFKKIDKIARKMGTPKEHPGRIEAGIEYCLMEALGNGHCWLEYEDLVDQSNLLLVMDALDSRERIEKALDRMIDQNRFSCVSGEGRFLVAFSYIYEKEKDLEARFTQAARTNPHFSSGQKGIKLLEKYQDQLNEEQFEAAKMALQHSISLISGGAGSGKSYTIAIINSICEAFNLNVVLSAPTGKAAKRLEEVSGKAGVTVHRLLGYDGKGFSRDASNPIDADILVVDEFSMVDVPLCWQLFEAIDFSRTSLILVGDHNQLPPVGPGNVLRDLIQNTAIPMVILKKVVRQAGVLKENCTAILKGDVKKSSEQTLDGRREWYLVDQFTEAEHAATFIQELFADRLEKLGFDLIKDVQVLTPTHNGLLGTKSLNIILQRLIQKKLWEVDVDPIPVGRRPKFYLHDKVIQTRNNYDLGVMNGAIGQVVGVHVNGTLQVDFDGIAVEIEKSSPNMGDLQLGYALTFHKCVSADTLISTSNGLIPIEAIHSISKLKNDSHCLLPVATHVSTGSIVNVSDEGEKICKQITTQRGYNLTAAFGHKVFVARKDGFKWVAVESLNHDDVVVLRRDSLKEFDSLREIEITIAGRKVGLDSDLAWLLGILIGDGNLTDSVDYRVEMQKSADELMLQYISVAQKYLGVKLSVRSAIEGVRYSAYFHNKEIREDLVRLGLYYSKASEKTVPWTILQSPAFVQRAFLRGLFDTDGGVNGVGIHFTTSSVTLAQEVHQLLLANGIVSTMTQLQKPQPSLNHSGAWRILITGAFEIRNFANKIGFFHSQKDFKLAVFDHCLPETKFKSNCGHIPFGIELIKELRTELIARGGRNYPEAREISTLLSRIISGRSKLNTYHIEWLVSKILDIKSLGKSGEMLWEIHSRGYHFEPITNIADTKNHVFDFLVPGDHSYIGNGFVNHNCQGSEFPCAIVLIHKSHSFMHHRNLFYTGVTRAKKTAIVLGDRWGIRNCASKCQVDERHTFLSGWLANARSSMLEVL